MVAIIFSRTVVVENDIGAPKMIFGAVPKCRIDFLIMLSHISIALSTLR